MLGSVPLAVARWRFRRRRADYYEYLALLMDQSDGRKTLRDIFQDDARRYGPRRLRGWLSARWAFRYGESGGDLSQTFGGTLPADDVTLLRAAQLSGAGALSLSLLDLAATVRLLDRTASAFVSTVAAALAACTIMTAVLFATPFYTVPALLQPFQSVPAEFHGPATVALTKLAHVLKAFLPLVTAGMLSMAAAVWWSLPNLTGRVRQTLDRVFIWRLYRDFHGIRFLALLGTTVRHRANVSTRLRDALMAQQQGASAWKSWHLDQMVVFLDDGVVGAETFRTGLLDEEVRWFLADMMAIHGVDEGLQRTRRRIEGQVVNDVIRRAVVLRWCLLLFALAVLLTMALWHYRVVDEMSAAMQAWHAV